ncbi:acetyl-CoA hydrolase/transferase C-terminal domain-containing protein [Aurantimonas sp. A2-1-M11]|uniref:acetyl-CoA hydrolase/transferase C-terminal domain-containing protein n=1 Tax=Aurantimonas sp. A2-1-M11 TaxID=3113712 RepID=UPI002F95D762
MTRHFTDADRLADAVIAAVGTRIVLALPLGLGKANHLANALYRRALRDPSIDLTIQTALSLDPPSGGEGLEGRFAGPLAERLYDGVTRLDYVADRKRGALPANVRVVEFFLQAGSLLGNRHAQQNYVSANYTHAAGYILASGVNVIGQMVAPSADRDRWSLSSNTDMTLDLLPALDAARAAGKPVLFVGEANASLPFMEGSATLATERFDCLLEGEAVEGARLFSVPRQPIGAVEYAIGLYSAALVKDGGTIQIGTGGLGDALAHALMLRHRAPATFRACLAALGNWPASLEPQTGPFEEGLYGLSEMFVDGLLELFEAGILKRPAGDGKVLHSGFFVGPQSFCERLRDMAPERRALLSMREISFVNALPAEDHARHLADRRDARFFNAAMLATALGDICSDQLDDGRVVSGVGGQYNFVAQAFALPGARSVIGLPSTRGAGGPSNIRWAYGHTTIPRHLKDIVITEYGVADLRGRTDRDTVVAMIGLADGSFQDDLAREAVAAGKLEDGFEPARKNTAAALADALRPFAAALPACPFGTELTSEEQRLVPALKHLKTVRTDRMALAHLAYAGWRTTPDGRERAALSRMGLESPSGWRERGLAAVLAGALRVTREDPLGRPWA